MPCIVHRCVCITIIVSVFDQTCALTAVTAFLFLQLIEDGTVLVVWLELYIVPFINVVWFFEYSAAKWQL